MPSQRWLVTVLGLALLLGACRAVEAPVERPRSEVAAATPAPQPAREADTASVVLGAWDRARARAFADGDVAALRALYVAGSRAGTSDVRLLRDYLRRGLRVEEMRMQLLEVEVLDRGPDRLRVRVTDRLAGAVVAGPGLRRRLPRDRASTRVVELRRGAGERWRVAEVSGWSGPPRAGR
jgi:hypothetical protein